MPIAIIPNDLDSRFNVGNNKPDVRLKQARNTFRTNT